MPSWTASMKTLGERQISEHPHHLLQFKKKKNENRTTTNNDEDKKKRKWLCKSHILLLFGLPVVFSFGGMFFEGGRLLDFHAGLELHSEENSEGGGNCYC